MYDTRNVLNGTFSFLRHAGRIARTLLRGNGPVATPLANPAWWQKPGLAVLFQTERKQGWEWDRDYTRFNRSISDEHGRLDEQFIHRCLAESWLALSREAGLDYHLFQAKWHDGICFFNTETTAWKTQHDWAGDFARASRDAGIPFMFYYSSVFDHNPQFDAIQPDPHSTASLIGNRREYLDYIRRHYDELITQYQPDGLWVDWYWAEQATEATITYLRAHHPGTVLAFNLSNLFPAAFNRIDFTSSEAHRYDGPLVRLRKEDALYVPVLTSAVLWSNLARATFGHPWELCTPAGQWWEEPALREDPLELLRILAVVLASGGKLMVGVLAQLNGELEATHRQQLRLLGEWYKPRKALFRDASPDRYAGLRPAGVQVAGAEVDIIASRYAEGVLLHLLNRDGSQANLQVTLDDRHWRGAQRVVLMPAGKELDVGHRNGARCVTISTGDVDAVDTILYVPGIRACSGGAL
jgi:hypothetical protein